MEKFHGLNKVQTAIFISGKGSNFKNLYKFSKSKNSPIEIVFVISSNKKAKGLIFAKRKRINNKTFEFQNRFKDEIQILDYLKKKKIKLICLAGFMKILSKTFIQKFNGKILNIHPSLLPKYKGINTHERVIKNKENFSGCTVHYVNSKLNSGRIILRKKIKLIKKETPQTLAKKILKEEHILYPKAIKKIFNL